MLRIYGMLCSLILMALLSGQDVCGSNSGESPSSVKTSMCRKLHERNILLIDYLIEPTEANLEAYKEAYFYIFQHRPLDILGPVFELNTELPYGILLVALNILKRHVPEANNSELLKDATTLLYGLDILREADYLAGGGQNFQKYIILLKNRAIYCPGSLVDPFAVSLLLVAAVTWVMTEFMEQNTAVAAQRFSELYWNAMRNYPELLGSFDDLSLVSAEAARKIYSQPNHTAFFAQAKCMKTVSSKVLQVVLDECSWELSEEQVKLLVEARGEERLISEICHDCRAWQVLRLMAPERTIDANADVGAGADTQDLFFDFNWDLFESCQSFDSVSIENLQCPTQRGAAVVRYIVATERYLHNALVVLHIILERIGTYYGMDEAEILESTEHRERLEPYISRVKKIASLRVELKEMFKPEWFDSNFIAPLLERPLSHRVRMFMKHKDSLYLHLLKESKLQKVYLFYESLHAASEPEEIDPVSEAHFLLDVWVSISRILSLNKSRFTVDFMFLLVDGLGEPEEHTSNAKYEMLLERLKNSILDHAQDKILFTDVGYFSAIFPEHPIAYELQSYLVSPVCVGPFSRAVRGLDSLHAEYSISELAVANGLYEKDELMIAALNSEWENIASDVRRIVQSFSACELIDCIFPQLVTNPDTLAMITRISGLFSNAQVDELVDLAKEIPMSASVASFIASPHGRRILSNASVLFKMEWKQLPTEMIKSMALATTSMPAWTGRDVLAIFRACDGIIHNFDAWLALIPDRVWLDLEVAAVVGVEVSFFSMLKVPFEHLHYYSRVALSAAEWLDKNVKNIPKMEIYLFVAKWMIRWELNFVQWSVCFKELSNDQIILEQCRIYHIMHAWEARARLLMTEVLKTLSDDKIANGLIVQLNLQPASSCRLSHLMEHAKSIHDSFKYEVFGSFDNYAGRVDELWNRIIKFSETTKNMCIDGIIARSLLGTFSKFRRNHTSNLDTIKNSQRKAFSNLEKMLKSCGMPERQKNLWVMRLKVCEAVDADGVVSEPNEMKWIGEFLKALHTDLPLNELAFLKLISVQPE